MENIIFKSKTTGEIKPIYITAEVSALFHNAPMIPEYKDRIGVLTASIEGLRAAIEQATREDVEADQRIMQGGLDPEQIADLVSRLSGLRGRVKQAQADFENAVQELEDLNFLLEMYQKHGTNLSEYAEILQKRSPAELAGFEPIAYNAVLPEDREYRAAWTWTTDDPAVDISIEAARNVARDQLRAHRNERFAVLDVRISRAMAEGDTAQVQEIERQRQALRDATRDPRIAQAATLDDLKATLETIKDNLP